VLLVAALAAVGIAVVVVVTIKRGGRGFGHMSRTSGKPGDGGSIGGSPAVNTVAPAISGTRGGTLTATPGTWTGATSVTGQWYADGVATGNTTTSFTDSDTSKSLEYRETALPGSVVASGYRGTQTSALTPVQWDTATSAPFTFSSDHLTATSTAASFQLVRSITTRSSGYFEVTIGNDPGGFTTVGLTTSTQSSTDWLGSGSNSIGYRSFSGAVVKGGATIATYSTYTTGDVIGVALKAGKVYFSKNRVWQGGADPVAGTGGIDVTSLTNPLPASSSSQPGAIFAANFAPSANVPSGIPTWEQNPSVSAVLADQPSTTPGNKQVNFTAVNLPAGSTGAQYKVETEAGQFVQGWTTATFTSPTANGTYPIAPFGFEGQKLSIIVRNVGGTVQTVGGLTATIPYVLNSPIQVGINDGNGWGYADQTPSREWFAVRDFGICGATATTADRQEIFPAGLVQQNYSHWAEAYSPTQVYPSANGEVFNFRQCRYQGLSWKTVDTTSQTRPAPSTADPAGTTTGWSIQPINGGADASLVGLTGDGLPTKLPDDTNLTIYCSYSLVPPVSRSGATFTVHCKTQPGIKWVPVFNSLNTVTITNVDLVAGTFDLNYISPHASGFNGLMRIDRANSTAALNSTFFLSGVAAYETGVPAADIGGPYMAVDKLADMTPFAGIRYLKPAPIERAAGFWTGTMTAATNTASGATFLWKYICDTANRLNQKFVRIAVPDIADSTYITAMATFFRDNLNAGIEIRVELSNEQWNGKYQNAADLLARANALASTDAAYQKNYLLHCREHNAMVAIWKSVFGAAYTTRVFPVLAWQSVTAISQWQTMLDFENTWQNVGFVSIAPYVDGNIGSYNSGATGDQASMNAAILAANQANFNSALTSYLNAQITYEVGLAQALFNFIAPYSVSKGLSKDAIRFECYEAGFFMDSPSTFAALGAGCDTTASNYFAAFKRSSAMGTIWGTYIDQLRLKAPGPMHCFVYVSDAHNWGIMDGVGQTTQEPYATIKTKALAYN
jgi:hypothetical protein